MSLQLRLFAPGKDPTFGQAVSRVLGVPPDPLEERDFEDGEHKSRPLVSVRDRDVFVVQSLFGDPERSVNDKLCRLLFFLGALRDGAAGRITAVVPYLCYARKDQKTKSRDPVITRYVAALFEAVGTDRVVTLDVHNPAAFQNAFRCGTDHLEARPLLIRHLLPELAGREVAVVSPDVGGVKRAERFREALAGRLDATVSSAFMDKRRSEGVVTGNVLVGDVEGRVALLVDDLIGTGTTMARAARACVGAGATEVLALATHGLFLEGAREVVEDPALSRVLVTNTVPPFRLDPELVRRKVEVVDAAPLVAEAIRRINEGGSLVELLEA
jgi:ribose-phosphate pyrophosphokinase